ncbi:MAG: FAD-dependent thymidylate synthase [Thermoprotei archaeon]|nr:FAD-dependent thymidylate synthase [Thermoprotei archaeon]
MLKNLGITVVVVEYTRDAPRIIASSSKVSLSSKQVEDILSISEEEVETWIKETFRRSHFSPWEHASYTFIIDGLSRVASHQLVRHRIASYTQLSHRYSEGYLRKMVLQASTIAEIKCPEKPKEDKRSAYACYAKALEKTIESENKLEIALIGYVPPPLKPEDLNRWATQMLKLTGEYYGMLAGGVKREDARYILPHSLRTRIVVTMNARELMQSFLPLRMCTRAQWEIRYIAWSLWRELMKIHPQLFKYAGPSCIFRENTTRWWPEPLEDYLEGRAEFTIPRCPELVENKTIRKCLLTASL